MTARDAWEIRHSKVKNAYPLDQQYEAWVLEACRLEDLLRRHEIKSTSDWRNLHTAQRMRASLAEDLMTAA